MKVTNLSYFQVLCNQFDESKIKHKKDCIIKNEYLSILDSRDFIWELIFGFVICSENNCIHG